MRLLELDLVAWGPFTGETVDLAHGSEGVHIIYGLNEAGKSSCLRALRALLYAVPSRTNDSFVHSYNDLRIGARIRNAEGRELKFIRRKGRKNTLLRPDGTPLGDEELVRFLPMGITEDLFRQMYALDHRRLREGGRELARGGGDLGEALFGAGMGTGALKRALEELEKEADELFRKRATTRDINRLIEAHDKLAAEIEELSVSGPEWEQHVRTRDELGRKRKEVSERISELRSEKERLERLKGALPALSRRREYLSVMGDLAGVPELREDFAEERRAAQRRLQQARSSKEKAEEGLKEINARIEELSIPERVLEHRDEISDLHQRAGSHKKALQDRPKLDAEQNASRRRCAAILQEIGQKVAVEQAGTVCVPTQVAARVRKLANTYRELAVKCGQAEDQAKRLRAECKNLQDELDEMPEERSADHLRLTLKAATREGNLDSQFQEVNEELQGLAEQARIELEKLPQWSGELEDLEGLSVPTEETVERFRESFTEVENEEKRLNERIRELQEEIEQSNTQIRALRQEAEVPTEADLSEARDLRHALWSMVRRRLEEGEWDNQALQDLGLDASEVPTELEKAMHAADDLADRLRLDSKRVAELAQHKVQSAQSQRRLEGTETAVKGIENEKEALQKEWHDTWSEVGILPLTPREMSAWRRQQQAIAELAEEIRLKGLRKCHTGEAIASHRKALNQLLAELGEEALSGDMFLATLIEHSGAIADAVERTEHERAQLRQGLRGSEQQLDEQQRKADEVEQELKAWQHRWSETVEALGLDTSAGPDEANAVLEKMQELRQELGKADGLAERIEGIDRDQDEFSKEVKLLCEEVAEELSERPVLEAVEELHKRLQKATEDKATLRELMKRWEEQEHNAEAAQSGIEEANRQLDVLLDEAGCEELDELPEIEHRASKQRKLRSQLESTEEDLSGYAAGQTLQKLAGEAEQVDADQLPSRIDELGVELEGLQEERDGLLRQLQDGARIIAAMDGNAEAAEKAEEAQHVAAQIVSKSERYAQLRLAAVMLRRGIDRYREQNQGPIVERAGEFFRELTCGSFGGLRTDYDEADNPVLLAQRLSGECLGLEALSDGARDQLFLALRLAFIERAVESSEALPLVLDDALVNFDDQRSKAALKTLAELSKKTQIIFFTHHQHLVDLAKAAVHDDALFVQSLRKVV